LQQGTVKKRRFTSTPWFWILVALGFVVAICIVAVLTDSVVYYQKVHDGVSVHRVDLSGMTEEQATAALTKVVDSAGSVTLQGGGKTWSVAPGDVGRVMDVNGAVAAALAVTRNGNFFEDVVNRFELYRQEQELALNGTVDQAKIHDLLGRVATDLHITPVNAGLTVENGKVKVIDSVNGRDADTSSLGGRMESLFVGLSSGSLDVPLVTKQPAVTTESNQAAQRAAETMISAPITLTDHDKTFTVTPEQIASWLNFRMQSANGAPVSVATLDEDKLTLFVSGLAAEVNTKAVNAKLTSGGSSFRVIPAVEGQTLDVDATVKKLEDAATKRDGRTIPVAVKVLEPSFTTAEAKATTFNDKLSSFTTSYNCPANRRNNVRLATKYSTNVFLAPGQEYNFDRQIGPRIASRGWALAPGITGPNTLDDVLGGGICQVSTTMFNAVFFAGLKVTERHNHSIYINHYPKGRDATVTGGGKNLRFVNDTGHYIWIRGTSTGVTTTISIYGTSDGRKVSYTVGSFYDVKYASPSRVTIKDSSLPAGQKKTSDGQTGRKLKTTRTVKLPNGKVLHNDTWISVWPAYPTTVRVGTG
jgi:vancomycin resistance protein YoaR